MDPIQEEGTSKTMGTNFINLNAKFIAQEYDPNVKSRAKMNSISQKSPMNHNKNTSLDNSHALNTEDNRMSKNNSKILFQI